MFTDRRTYGEFLAAGEGMATNVLAQRLEHLDCAGIIARTIDPTDGRRAMYRLTPKGMDLAPMLLEMVVWAAAHEETDAPPKLVAAMKRDRKRFIAGLPKVHGEGIGNVASGHAKLRREMRARQQRRPWVSQVAEPHTHG